jgi:integrase/recombinase XerD
VGSPMFSEDFSLADVAVAPDRKNSRSGKSRILSPEELEKLFGAMKSDRSAAIFAICYFCAGRIGEVLALRCEDIEGDSIVFRASTTKTGESRTAMITPPLRRFLDAYMVETTGPLFPGERISKASRKYSKKDEATPLKVNKRIEGHLSTQSADKILRGVCDELGFNGVSTHSFRRSFVSQQVKLGRTPAQIAKLTGHKSLGSLLEYFGA